MSTKSYVFYHGSNSKFRKFSLDPKLIRHDPITVLPEGVGVYLALNKRAAGKFGKIIYEASPSAKCNGVVDFRKKTIVQSFLGEFLASKDTKKLLIGCEENVSESVVNSKVSVSNIIKEASLVKEEEIWEKLSETEADKYYDYIDSIQRKWKKYIEKYIFIYNDPHIKGGVAFAFKAESLKILKDNPPNIEIPRISPTLLKVEVKLFQIKLDDNPSKNKSSKSKSKKEFKPHTLMFNEEPQGESVGKKKRNELILYMLKKILDRIGENSFFKVEYIRLQIPTKFSCGGDRPFYTVNINKRNKTFTIED